MRELCCLRLLVNLEITAQNVYMDRNLVAAMLSVKKSAGKCRWMKSSGKTSSVHYIMEIKLVATWALYNTMEYSTTFISLTKAHIFKQSLIGLWCTYIQLLYLPVIKFVTTSESQTLWLWIWLWITYVPLQSHLLQLCCKAVHLLFK